MTREWGAGRRPKGVEVCPICLKSIDPGDGLLVATHDGVKLLAHGHGPGGCSEQLEAVFAFMRPRPPEPFDPVLVRRIRRAVATARRKG